jgi:hypothetical protein
MNGLLQSRKFWLLIVDTVVSVASYFITKYVNPEAAKDALFLIAAMQPVFVMVIAGIAIEDAAEKRTITTSGYADWMVVQPNEPEQ